MSRSAASLGASLLLLAMAPAPVPAALAACPIANPSGGWLPAEAFKAVAAGKTNAEVAFKADGFNRTVSFDGACPLKFASGEFTCASTSAEWLAKYQVPPNATLRFGAGSCPLTGFAMYKTPKGPHEAEIRFQFEQCLGAPVTSAAVIAGVRKDKKFQGPSDVPLGSFATQVCRAVTTTLPPSLGAGQETMETSLQVNKTQVGAGKCDAAIHGDKKKNISTEVACSQACTGSMLKDKILKKIPCSGYAFKEKVDDKDENCILFEGEVTQIKNASGWTCYNMSRPESNMSTATPPPPVIEAEKPVELDLFEKLTEVFGDAGAAYMQQISPPADSPACFSPIWYFTLEDYAGKPVALSVSEAEWEELETKLPITPKATVNVSAPQILDRVVVDFCGKGKGWGHTTCFVPTVAKDDCRSLQVTTATVAGVFTSLGTWVLVGVVYFLCHARKNPGNKQYEQLVDADRPSSAACPTRIVLILTFVALGGALLCSWTVVTFLNHAFRGNGCFDYDEFLIVILAVMLSVALAIILILQYMVRIHPAHSHPLFTSPAPPKASKLVMVEVEHGTTTGHPVNMHPGHLPGQVDISQGNVLASHGSSPMASGMSAPTDTKPLIVR